MSFIEDQARIKYQEKLKSYQPKQIMEEEPVSDDWTEEGDEFSFNMPSPAGSKGRIPAIDEPFDFGVAPNDPRFYENANVDRERGSMGNRQMDEENSAMAKNTNEGPYLRIKDPLIVNPKPNPDSFYKAKEMQGLLHKWGRNNVGGPGSVVHGQEVVQRPVNLTEQSSFSIYGVALIAGVSAAITIALIALGVGWWTWVLL